jgi:hypothetical protein
VNNKHWHSNREKIYGWMVANDLKSYAELYKGAVENLYKKTPGYVRFVSHAVRDLMNGMAATKLGRTRNQVDYVDLVGKLLMNWKKFNLPKGTESLNPVESDENTQANLIIPREVFVSVQKLFQEHEEGRKRSEESPFIFLRIHKMISFGTVDLNIKNSHNRDVKQLNRTRPCHFTIPAALTIPP